MKTLKQNKNLKSTTAYFAETAHQVEFYSNGIEYLNKILPDASTQAVVDYKF